VLVVSAVAESAVVAGLPAERVVAKPVELAHLLLVVARLCRLRSRPMPRARSS